MADIIYYQDLGGISYNDSSRTMFLNRTPVQGTSIDIKVGVPNHGEVSFYTAELTASVGETATVPGYEFEYLGDNRYSFTKTGSYGYIKLYSAEYIIEPTYGFAKDKGKVDVCARDEVYTKQQLKSAVKKGGDQVTVTLSASLASTKAIVPLPQLKDKAILGIVGISLSASVKQVPILSFLVTEDLSGNPKAEVTLGNNSNDSITTRVMVEVTYID